MVEVVQPMLGLAEHYCPTGFLLLVEAAVEPVGEPLVA